MLSPLGLARTDRQGTMDHQSRNSTLHLARRAAQPRSRVNRGLRAIVATSLVTGLVASSGVLSSPTGATVSGAKTAPSVKGSVSVKSTAVKRNASVQRLASPNEQTPDRAARVQTVIDAAMSQIGQTTIYDPVYVALAYPGGDVPMVRGVCTDVVIRAYRAIGVDLQVAIHQDMRQAFSAYPSSGRSVPDRNIDHRRVRNMLVFFARAGASAPKSLDAADYLPGDIVMWDVSGLAHTGLVVTATAPGSDRRLIVHNIGSGAQLEDILFEFPITGHFRYMPATGTPAAS